MSTIQSINEIYEIIRKYNHITITHGCKNVLAKTDDIVYVAFKQYAGEEYNICFRQGSNGFVFSSVFGIEKKWKYVILDSLNYRNFKIMGYIMCGCGISYYTYHVVKDLIKDEDDGNEVRPMQLNSDQELYAAAYRTILRKNNKIIPILVASLPLVITIHNVYKMLKKR